MIVERCSTELQYSNDRLAKNLLFARGGLRAFIVAKQSRQLYLREAAIITALACSCLFSILLLQITGSYNCRFTHYARGTGLLTLSYFREKVTMHPLTY